MRDTRLHGARDIQEERTRKASVRPFSSFRQTPSMHSEIKTDTHSDSDVWAIGVITYFLLCGYTPFDRDSNLEEMQAILVADYSFTPEEYWSNVSDTARAFIKRCLTIDPMQRMTAHDALAHPWVAGADEARGEGKDLLPTVKKNFNARRTLHAAIDTIRAINQLRAGGGAAMGMMDGALSKQPEGGAPKHDSGNGGDAVAGARPPMPVEGEEDRMEGVVYDSRGNGAGQTEEMIKEQERRIREATQGLWGKRI